MGASLLEKNQKQSRCLIESVSCRKYLGNGVTVFQPGMPDISYKYIPKSPQNGLKIYVPNGRKIHITNALKIFEMFRYYLGILTIGMQIYHLATLLSALKTHIHFCRWVGLEIMSNNNS
jgi:hypothetical protein